MGYDHLPVSQADDPKVAEEYLPIIHLVFSNLKAWLHGTHHGAISPSICKPTSTSSPSALTAASIPFNAFRILLGIGTNGEGPTYDGLYDGTWKHATMESHHD